MMGMVCAIILSGSLKVVWGQGEVGGGNDVSGLKYDARLSEYAYPFEVETYRFESQGLPVEMSYMYLPTEVEEGDDENLKSTVVLLHGKNFNGAYWEGVARQLHEQGYGVLIPDQIGFGKSSKPAGYQYSFAGLADNTKGLMDELGIDKAVVVGHSMGGMLGTRFSLMYPEKVEKLVLVNPIGLENYLDEVEYKDVDFFLDKEMKTTPEEIYAYQKKNYYDGDWNETYEKLTRPVVGQLQGDEWESVALANARTYDMIFTQPVVEEFGKLAVPTVLILGTRDRSAPGRGWQKAESNRELGRYDRLGEEIVAGNGDIELIKLEGLGHVPQVEAPERFMPVFVEVLESGDSGGEGN
ncbi:alpha/beta hydrolase [Planctomycetota bacterium]|nr:alpha/beta hydrolase [Planctomycetota bacterium]